MPTNKELTPIYSSPRRINEKADQALVDSLIKQFPIENKHYSLHLENVAVQRKHFHPEDTKKAILESKSLTYPIVGDISLVSKLTGKVVDRMERFPLLDTFAITDKHTLMYKGNNYSVSNQLQLLPGAYTRTRENTGELETHFNTGSGSSFRVVLEPKSQVFYVEINGSSIPVAPLLKTVFGVSDVEVEKYIPKETWDANLAAVAGKEDKYIKGFYNKFMYQKDSAIPMADMVAQLKERIESSKLHTETTKATLGKSFEAINGEVLLRTLKKLVQVHTGELPEDNRDSLEFKRVQNLPDYLRTRFAKEHETVKRVKNRLTMGLEKIDQNNPKIKAAVPSKPYNKIYSSYLQQSHLISTPEETNPIESYENVGKVTVLGPEEGGISDERAVPMGARNIDPSHLGILDPSRTPESSHAGIDQRFTLTARRDSDGGLYARVLKKDKKTATFASVHELMNSVVGFSDYEKDGNVQAQDHGVLKTVPASEVNYWIAEPSSLYTVTTNLVPFLNSNHPGRLTMAGKAIPQALSLVEREQPLVQTADRRGVSFVQILGSTFGTKADVKGEVIKVDSSGVKIRQENGEIFTQRPVKNLPFNMKGFFDDEQPLVKEGDKVHESTVLFENNYTKDGVVSLGKNLEVAYLPYKGYNHEDGIVIRKGAAEGMSSHHAYKIDYDVTPDTVAKKAWVKRYFPGKFTKDQLDKLDDNGYAIVGETLNSGDPVYAVLEKREPSPEDRILGKLHKTLVNPYRLITELWTHKENGSVVDAHTTSKAVRILARSVKPLEIGDKLTGLHGNKGIVSLIIPDDEMPLNKTTGKPMDLLLNPASVTSRINLGQLMETAAGKIAKATGKPYLVTNFSHGNNIKTLQEGLAKHGLSDTDELVDPKTGHSYGQVLTGPQYILKLYKTTDQNYSSRNVGGYDNTMQPTKGGESGSKSVGLMEMLGLVGSNARKNLQEISTTKSENNEDYWTKFIRGQPLPKPKMTFATRKFFDYLKGSGINVKIEKDTISASPMTDREILGQSNGKIDEPLMLNAKNLEPEDGGLFDYAVTGGLRGEKWSHYTLAESVVNPVMESPVKSILGLTTKEFDGITSGKYGVKQVGEGHFGLHDTASGNHIRDIKI